VHDRRNWQLTPEERNAAREAFRILRGSGISIVDAARRAVEGRRALEACTVAEAANRFLRTRLQECRRATFDWYEERLGFLLAAFGDRQMDEVRRSDVRDWIEKLNTGATAKAANVRAARALWRWAMRHDPQLAATDPTLGIPSSTRSRNGAEPTVLDAAQGVRILAAAGRHRSALAVMMFAGIRPEEVAGSHKPRLLWRHVNTEDRIIIVPGEVSKTGKRRPLEGLPPALWRWLTPGTPEEPVAAVTARQIVSTAASALGWGSAARPWPQDCLRHTFASHALALTADPGQVSLWLGHEGAPTLLHRHYRGLSTRAAAEAWFGLAPAAR
jgi:integrase